MMRCAKVFSVVVAAVAFLIAPVFSQEVSLQGVNDAVSANCSLVPSGSCSFVIEEFHPNDNVLASHETRTGFIPPILAVDHDVQLEGYGWFKWQGNRYIGFEKRYVLYQEQDDDSLRIMVRERTEAFDGKVARTLTRSFHSAHDPLSQTVIPMDEKTAPFQVKGTVDEDHSSIGGYPVFRELAFFSQSLLGSADFYLKHFDPIIQPEGDHVVLAESDGVGRYVLDPGKSYMRVGVRVGTEGIHGLFRTASYTRLDPGVWFPTSCEETSWENGRLLYRLKCNLTDHEFNKTYPDTDFVIDFPQGTRVYDAFKNERFVVGAAK